MPIPCRRGCGAWLRNVLDAAQHPCLRLLRGQFCVECGEALGESFVCEECGAEA